MFLAVAGLKYVIGIGKHQLSAIAQACNFVVDEIKNAVIKFEVLIRGEFSLNTTKCPHMLI